MAQLKPLDAAFVDAEDSDRNASFAIGSIAIFEGPPPAYDEFLSALSGRIQVVPLYRKKLRKVPLGLGPPVWVDDPHFDLSYHVRRTALPAPCGDEQLRVLMARVMTERLDRDYPLWEYWLVEHVDDDRWALITKIHHCMVDGIGGAEMYRAILDFSPEPPSPSGIPDNPPPSPSQPSTLAMTARAAANAVLLPLYDAGAVQRSLSDPARAVRQAAITLRGLARFATALPPAPKSSLSGPIGRQRRFTWVRTSLDDVKAIKNELGGTVNDVFLAAITGGFRELLLTRGEVPTRATVPSLVPVSVRRPGEEGVFENRVSALVTNLPVDIPDLAECLATVSAQLTALKSSNQSEAGEAFVGLRRYTPFALASLFVRAVFSIPQREIVTVTTSVPGPQQPLYALGRRLLEIIPYVPIATTLRTGVCIFTYNGQVTFGITGDYDSTPDLEVLARGIEGSIAGLLTAARRRRGKRR